MNARPRPATRTDVARLAGTSVAVVSYVLNDGPRNVSAERRRRVLDAVAELNYQPNAIARSLTSTRTNTIGLIVPNINNGFFSELALAVEDAALDAGSLVFIGNSEEDRAREEAYVESFLRQRVDAVLVIGVAQESSIQRLVDAGVTTVVLDRPLRSADTLRVGIDHRRAAYDATCHLVGHGHTDIACVTGPAGLPVADERQAGWRDALAEHDLTPGPVVGTPFSLEGGAAAFVALRGSGALPGAVFVATDEQARGVLSSAGAAGVAVPGHLAMVSVDGTRASRFSNPSITSMAQPYAALAAAAVAGVHEPRSGLVTLSARLRIGRSCGCVDPGPNEEE